ncbi:hypothetical protein PROFUN_09947 [Planoprotostelium fungivorum]|uniref:SH3 domain-containing protein n=1 Tax=Planoprotostelium fungivorum TaxID=1890364 RepID=A0A2P6NGA7_9EUKA|nr:hypothetical protein PROFUN_09947 [Planoprotostelium fungivorum]
MTRRQTGTQFESGTMADDEWEEEGELKPPKVIATAIVKRDYIPTTHEHLTLILDDLVFVFNKNVPGKPGFWEGETKGVMGIFPAGYVKEMKDLSRFTLFSPKWKESRTLPTGSRREPIVHKCSIEEGRIKNYSACFTTIPIESDCCSHVQQLKSKSIPITGYRSYCPRARRSLARDDAVCSTVQ